MNKENLKKMIFRSSVVVVALFGLFLFVNKEPKVASTDKEALILQGLMQTLEYVHYAPKKIDDQFSQNVYNTFLERMDSQKRFLTNEDISKLKKYENEIDNQVNLLTFEFFDTALPMIEKGITKSKAIVEEVLSQPMTFDVTEEIQADPKKKEYPKNDKDLKDQWRKALKYDILVNWTNAIDEQKDNADSIVKKTDDQLKQEAIKEVRKRYSDWFDRLGKLRRSDRMEVYLGTIANYFDPHTDYFSPKEKIDFDINMGGKLEGIGARLQTDGDYTKISSVVVGGPAWKTKKVNDEDIILKVAQKGEPAIDIAGMRVDDVVQQIRGKKGTRVILTLKKKDGSITDVEIERDEVQLEDTKAKSVLLNMAGNVQNIGYIFLPKFYSSFDTEGGNSCAVDVAEEIKKLKSQNVNGIILDLRNNSGGSLNDVVDMSGLFIESGPIVQVKGRESQPSLHVDKDPSVLYDGPLIIMVNQFSASASEIIAAALQDYERAIIVGSKSTFGKGTVQRFYDLDKGIRGYEDLKPLGNVKMTTQKFYRINGGSTQLKGVIPDIILPDTYHYIETGEKEYDNPLDWTEIQPVEYHQNVVKLDHKATVIANSNKRVENSTAFGLILQSAEMVKKERDNSKFSLLLKDYRSMINQRDKDNEKLKNIFKNDVKGLDITNLQADIKKINSDESFVAKNKAFIDDLKKDVYIEESMYIMKDMITLEKSFVSQSKKISFVE